MERNPKRLRLSVEADDLEEGVDTEGRSTPRSLTHPVSPPRKRNRLSQAPKDVPGPSATGQPQSRIIKSPFQLSWIRDAPASSNVDALTLRDLLGDPLISECWDFNYLHDIDFLLSAFDEDTRHLVNVHVVHGFWKREDESRLALQEQAAHYKNVTLHAAFMPEMFGTHHSKMLILLRHDDTAQVIIHTANMILRDWTNMTQAIWRSPLLPLLSDPQKEDREAPTLGSGAKFKVDLLNYLRAYDARRITCKPIIESLAKYDFSAVRGVLIASIPGRHNIHDDSETRWGWAAVRQTLRSVPVQDNKSEVVVQISSIATLGPQDTWLQKTLFDALGKSKNTISHKPSFKVVFPTPDEIRRSLDGYASGSSIHTKIQSAQQAKQLLYLKPIFCHWANDAPNGKGGRAPSSSVYCTITDKTIYLADLADGAVIQEAGRKRAAPHIKTYIRYNEESIDWAMVTSANLSKQAWGEAAASSGEMRISSWEIGVMVWPSLFGEGAEMVGTFQSDTPSVGNADGNTVVGLRIPYNLPLQPYGKDEKPWVATASYNEPDWMGQSW